MDNFTFYAPTYFAFGRDAENQAGALVKRFGGHILPGDQCVRDCRTDHRLHTKGVDNYGINRFTEEQNQYYDGA